MKAAVVTPGKKDSIRVVYMARPDFSDDEVWCGSGKWASTAPTWTSTKALTACIAEKAIEQVFKIQERIPWEPERALVMGAGSLGLLATFILRDMGFETCAVARKEKKA